MARRRLWWVGIVAAALTAATVQAQTAAPAASASAPATPAVDPAAVQALRDMGAYLQSLRRFEVSSQVSGERVLADGQKLQHDASATLQVARPSKLRVMMRTALAERELFFDGKTLAVYAPAQKYYSTVDFSGTVGALIDRIEQGYGFQVPLADLFRWGTPEASIDKLESAMNAGQGIVDGALCDHYAFRQGTIDWQIWIAVGRHPLPRKVVITSRADEARPQSATRLDWKLNPSFPESAFRFVPPSGATKVEWVPRKAK